MWGMGDQWIQNCPPARKEQPQPGDGDPKKKPHTRQTQPVLSVKPRGTYPIFLFLFKFLFELPDLPLEALDVLSELRDGLGLLAVPTTASGRASRPAMVTDKTNRSRKGLGEHGCLTFEPRRSENSRRQLLMQLVYQDSPNSSLVTSDLVPCIMGQSPRGLFVYKC